MVGGLSSRLLRSRLARAHIKGYKWFPLTKDEGRAMLRELRHVRWSVWVALVLGVVIGWAMRRRDA